MFQKIWREEPSGLKLKCSDDFVSRFITFYSPIFCWNIYNKSFSRVFLTIKKEVVGILWLKCWSSSNFILLYSWIFCWEKLNKKCFAKSYERFFINKPPTFKAHLYRRFDVISHEHFSTRQIEQRLFSFERS